MGNATHTDACIDMTTFYASVECRERGLNPFETCLVVADVSRGSNALCLAISPKMKALGVRNRCRLSEIPKGIKYIIAPPQMALYIEVAADIYDMYLDYMSPDDIHVYSVDESFIDLTPYLKIYNTNATSFVQMLINQIAKREKIPAKAGIGTNLYLAKIALDISAKKNKTPIAFLDENIYRETLWTHRPINDFWNVGEGTANRLARLAMYDMRGVANAPVDLLYRTFGVNAELLIDHAWGRETCTIADIKSYNSKSRSISSSQILPRDYSFEEAKIVMSEMVQQGAYELMRRHSVASRVCIQVGYTHSEIPHSRAAARLGVVTALKSKIAPVVIDLYEKNVNRTVKIRRLELAFEDVVDESYEIYDLFTNMDEVEKEKSREHVVLAMKEKYGKNAVLVGTNLLDCATQRERNTFIGGHRAGK